MTALPTALPLPLPQLRSRAEEHALEVARLHATVTASAGMGGSAGGGPRAGARDGGPAPGARADSGVGVGAGEVRLDVTCAPRDLVSLSREVDGILALLEVGEVALPGDGLDARAWSTGARHAVATAVQRGLSAAGRSAGEVASSDVDGIAGTSAHTRAGWLSHDAPGAPAVRRGDGGDPLHAPPLVAGWDATFLSPATAVRSLRLLVSQLSTRVAEVETAIAALRRDVTAASGDVAESRDALIAHTATLRSTEAGLRSVRERVADLEGTLAVAMPFINVSSVSSSRGMGGMGGGAGGLAATSQSSPLPPGSGGGGGGGIGTGSGGASGGLVPRDGWGSGSAVGVAGSTSRGIAAAVASLPVTFKLGSAGGGRPGHGGAGGAAVS